MPQIRANSANRSVAIPFDLHLSFAFELMDETIHLLAIKVGDLITEQICWTAGYPWQGKAKTPKARIRPRFCPRYMAISVERLRCLHI